MFGVNKKGECKLHRLLLYVYITATRFNVSTSHTVFELSSDKRVAVTRNCDMWNVIPYY